jgi:tape measure domain-containing protein
VAKGNRDVELVIRARNEASKVLGAVTSALDSLTKSQSNLAQGSAKTGDMLSELGAAFGKLNQQMGGMSATAKLAADLERAVAPVARLKEQINGLAAAQATLSDELAAAEGNLSGYTAEALNLQGVLNRQSAATKNAETGLKSLNGEISAGEAALSKHTKEAAKYGNDIQKLAPKLAATQAQHRELTQEIIRAEAPSKKLIASFERTDAALVRQSAAMTAAQAAYSKNAAAASSLEASLARMRGLQIAAAQSFDEAKAAQDQSADSLKKVAAQIKATTATVGQLGSAMASNEASIKRHSSSLIEANADLLATELANKRARVEVYKLGAAFREQVSDLSGFQAQLNQYKQAWEAAGAAIKSAGGFSMGPPTAEMQRNLLIANESKSAYLELRNALAQFENSLRSAGNDTVKLAAAQQTFVTSLARVEARTNSVTAAQQRLTSAAGTAGTAVVSTANRQAGAYQQVATSVSRMGNEAGKAGKQLTELEAKGRQALSWSQRLNSEMIALATSFVGVYAAINQLTDVTKTFQDMEAVASRLGVAFGGNTAVIGREMRWLQDEADRLGVDIRVLSGEYSKLAVATKGSALEGDATRKIFVSLSEAFRVNKLSSAQMELAFNAVSQMVNKGVVSMEELRQQLAEKMPGAFTLAAKSMGKTTAEFTKLVSEGKVATDEFLPKFAAELDKTFGPQLPESLKSLTTEIGQFQNELTKAQMQVAKGGFIEGLRVGLETLTAFFKSDEGVRFFNSLGAAAGGLIKVVAALPKYFDEISVVLAVLLARKATGWFTEMAVGANKLTAVMKPLPAAIAATTVTIDKFGASTKVYATTTAATLPLIAQMQLGLTGLSTRLATTASTMTIARASTIALAGAMNVLRGAFALVGGLPGILLTGLTVAFTYWLGSTNDVVDSMGEHQRQMTALIDSYSTAKNKAGDWAKAVESVSLGQAESTLNELQKSLQDQTKDLATRLSTAVKTTMVQISRGFKGNAVFGETGKQLTELTAKFKGGKITALEFSKALDDILRDPKANERIKKLIRDNSALAKSTIDTEQALANQAKAVEAKGGAVTGVSPKVLALAKSFDELAKAAGLSGEAVQAPIDTLAKLTAATETVETAIQKMTDKIPGIGKELKYLDGLKGLDEIFNAAKATAEANGLIGALERLKVAHEQARVSLAQEQVSSGIVDRIVGVESGGDANAKNPNSTATGLGQFIESTWVRMFKQYFPDRADNMSKEAILALRSNADLSKNMVELYARENAKVLQKAGVAVSDAAIYLSHFLGPGGAVAVLTAAPSTPLADILSAEVIEANKKILKGQTAGGLQDWAAKKVGTSDTELDAQTSLLKIDQERAKEAEKRKETEDKLTEKQKEFNTRIKEAAALDGEKTATAQQRTLAQEQELALTKAENDARRAGVTLEEDSKAALMESVRLKYEMEKVTKDQAAAEERVNTLTQLRRDILQQMQLALESGNGEVYDKLQLQLVGVDEKLKAALQSQLKLAHAMSDPEAAAAAAAAIQLQIDALGKLNEKLILTPFNAGKLFGDNIIAGADNFLAKIRETGDVLNSLKDAFRQFASDFLLQMAQMILKQAIFNALKAGFGGATGGVGGGILSAFGVGVQHNGGVTGSGNRQRSVSPAWFSNATRYHTGGVAGLKPNEVPTILEKGEEVLPATDPRHVNNGGGSSSAQSVKIVNAIDAGSFVSAGVEDVQGQKAILNFIRANSSAVKGALGV